MLIFNYPVPTNVKKVFVYSFYSLSCLRDFPTLHSLTSLICHRGILPNPFMPSPLTMMYKSGAELSFFGASSQSVDILLSGNCQFGSNELIKILAGLDVSHI